MQNSRDVINTDLQYICEELNEELISFSGKRVLITGGAGSIGSEIAMQLIKSECNKICILDNSELNMHNFIKKKFKRYKLIKWVIFKTKPSSLLIGSCLINTFVYLTSSLEYKPIEGALASL